MELVYSVPELFAELFASGSELFAIRFPRTIKTPVFALVNIFPRIANG